MSFVKTEGIQLDLGGILTPPLSGENGVLRSVLVDTAQSLGAVLENLLAPGAGSGFVKLAERPADLRILRRVQQILGRLNVQDWVHVGIGGSSLGSEMIFGALSHPMHNQLSDDKRPGPRVHFVDNIDPDSISGLLEVLDLSKTAFHIVSKSGHTLETLAIFDLIRQAFGNDGRELSWQERCVISSGVGRLETVALSNEIVWNDFPQDVGGRFSALTSGSLLTPSVAGINVRDIACGAQQQLEILKVSAMESNVAAMGACATYSLSKKGTSISVLMPYADRLEAFGRWYLQLFAESLGKRINPSQNVPISPFLARGATDQHSQLQLFLDGPKDKFVSFIRVKDWENALTLRGFQPGEDLKGLALSEVMRQAQRGTQLALAEADCPSASWLLPELNEKSLGALILIFELLVAYLAELYGVNAYDQPAVDRGKNAINILLGLDGSCDTTEKNAIIPEWII